MTKQEAIDKILSVDSDDVEYAHIHIDNILCDFLRTNGHEEIVKAVEFMESKCGGFWYA